MCWYYLDDAVGPALAHSVSGPHVMPVLRQSLHQGVLVGGEFDVVQIQRGGFVPVTLCVTVGETTESH